MKPGALLLAHGAGSGPDHSCLLAIEAAVAPLPCERMAFPYRAAGRRAPDRAPVLLESVREHASRLVARTRIRPSRLVLGGRSMGGRMCSMAVAEGLPARALVLISYPLHPPGKPEKLRVEHLPKITVPCLFVHGTRDPFGTPDDLREWTATIPGDVTHHFIDGGRHDLARKDAEVATVVREWLCTLR